MADNRSYAALEWVIGEIGETLKQARQALEAYVENTEDTTRIRFCLTHIHQVHGSLQMVEFYGAALLAEEMENLAQALMNKSVRNESEAQEVLMRAILQMPVYLDQVKSNRKDHPSSVLPLLNDLRTVRGEALLTETKLFTPNLAPAHHIADKNAAGAIDANQFSIIILKLRKMYQAAAAGVIRDVARADNIGYLYKVFGRLRKLTQGTARQPLWDISLALLEGLESEAIEASASVKNLLRQIDKEIKNLEVDGVSALNNFTNDELIKNLLYYIARAPEDGKHIRRIKSAYNLETALPPTDKQSVDGVDEEIIAPDLDAIRSVVTALKDELDAIKHALDVSLTDKEKADVTEALPIIKRVADTMAVLGIGDLRKQILAQGEKLAAVAEDEEIPADLLMQVAGKIIEIESSLELMASGTGRGDANAYDPSVNALDQAQESVLRESRNGLEQAKDAIIEYIASQWNRDHLISVPNHLREISGGLDMMPLPKPAAILTSCASYIEQQLLAKEATPEWQTLDTLADAIASVEYYLERLSGDREEDDELLLGVAEESVQSLGYPIPTALRSGGSMRSHDDADVSSVLGKMASLEEVEIGELPERDESDHASVPKLDDELDIAAKELDNLAVQKPEETQVDEASAEAQNNEVPASDVVEPASVNVAESTLAEDDEDNLIDDEILEIFIEEAAEVQDTINEFFPRWAADFDDQEALIEFRRGFHTLKGSGRMVGANDVGELAWAVENMLNRVLDNTVAASDGHVALIQKVLPLLPELVSAFEHRQANPHPDACEKLSAWAEQLSKGEMPAALMEDDSVVVETASTASSDEDDDATDAMLWSIFGSEAITHLEVVQHYIAEMDDSAPLFTPPSEQMQRALHTLKGSAHMADVKLIAELVTPLEHFVKELRIYQVIIDTDILQLLKDGVEYIQSVLSQIELGQELEIPRLSQYLARVAELKDRYVTPLVRQRQEEDGATAKKVDPELLSIFMAEEVKLLLDADEILLDWQQEKFDNLQAQSMVLELATLERGSEHANLPPMANLSRQLRQVYELVIDSKLTADDKVYRVLTLGHSELLDMIDSVAVGQNLNAISETTQTDLAEVINSADDVVNTIPSFGQSRSNQEEIEIADFEAVDDLAENQISELEITDLENVDSENIEPEVIDVNLNNRSTTADEIEINISQDEIVEPVSLEIEEPTLEPTTPEATEVAEVDESDDSEEVDLEIFEIFIEEAEELLEEIDGAVHQWEEDWSDKEQVESLKRSLHTLKGGARLAGLMGLGELAHEFESFLITKGENVDVDADFFAIVHDYQDKLINGTDKVKARVDGHMPDGLQEIMSASAEFDEKSLDKPAEVIETEEVPLESKHDVVAEIEQDQEVSSSEPSIEDATPDADLDDKSSRANILPFAPKPKMPATPSGATTAAGSKEFTVNKHSGNGPKPSVAARRAGPQEVVKVSAELLEELVNLAGETSISRGRLEEQNSELGYAIDEMEATVQRVQEQLRRLDIETEAQMIFRQEQMEEAEDFDPLEMDRYSQLQQLSRSLMESASDLMDLTGTLNDKTRDTETLLLQQSRINTDLQEGLMRSRMVPFSRLVPRLRRIVRQISTELGKHVSFELDNVEGELDRSVLERMIAPLEHMLRNAVDHGIEPGEERIKKGKAETGRIVLSLGREGGDVLMRLVDDGRGLDLKRIREKAIERGLMSEEAQLSDHDIMQFILNAGFSTADKITQISGRGVGMDVVHSEIKQLGGSMFINSREGQGTEFIIRLPFTVSVNRALMIQIGEDNYAIPLNTIEGIVRVSPFELEHYYQDENARFEYAGENYRVRYLGSMLDANNLPRLAGQALPMPVVLVRTVEHVMAIQVDKLMGSREIVVKSLGQQFSAVEGLSGATVMGDGSVVVILDPHAMIRKEMALLAPTGQQINVLPSVTEEVNKAQTIMVVDDSVTVRKVTTRFLEREGYEVITAKDGADALLTLQDQIPDLMLLDIEMPRMDGFEVAKNIRSTSRLKNIPIIMITSRTGEKHRDRALSLGVNDYMGKPYQEEKLLSNIKELIGEQPDL
ncbi:hypothetical protein NBRC116493_00750 [Aurantivibrio infirmus]